MFKQVFNSKTLVRFNTYILVFVFLAIFAGSNCYAQPAGPNNPSANSTVGVDDGNWSGAANAYASDNSYASFANAGKFDNGNNSDILKLQGFGFAVPAGATIDGIIVEIERYADNTATDNVIQLLDAAGNQIGDNKAAGGNWDTSDPNSYNTYGGAADTWTSGLGVADVNDPDFGVAIQVTAGADNMEAFIDHARITIHYTPGGGACGAGGGELATVTSSSFDVCPASTAIFSSTITENASNDIPAGSSGNMLITISSSSNFQFTGNSLSLSWNTSGDLDVSDNLISSPSISMTDAYTLNIYNLNTKGGGGGENQIDHLIIQAEVQGVNLATDVIERCGGTFTTQFLDNGTDIASLSAVTMTYNTSVVTQTETSDVPPNSSDNEIIGINISVTGACSPVNATSIVFNTTGTTDVNDISNATIYYTGSSSVYSPINEFGSQASPSGATTIAGSQTLSEGDNYFWVTYDLPVGATTGNFLDASAVSVTVGGTSYDITSAPAGNREIGAFFTSGATNDWNNGGTTWNLTACGNAATAGTPGVATNAYICDGHVVNLTADESVKNLVVDGTLNLGNNNLTVYGDITFISGTINSNQGDVILVTANKKIDGDGSINFTSTGEVLVQNDFSIAPTANVTVTGSAVNLDVDNKTLTNYGELTLVQIKGGGGATGRVFRNESGSTVRFTNNSGWDNKVTVHFDDAPNTVVFAANHTIVTNNPPDNNTFYNLEVESGTLTIPSATFYIKGNFTNNSNVDAITNAPNTFVFNGTAAQTLCGTGATTLNNIVLNNSSGFTLTQNYTVNGTLTLSDGVVTTGANILIHSNTTASNLTVTSGTVYGNFRRHIANPTSDTYEFPISKGAAATDKFQFNLIGNAIAGVTYIDAAVGSITEAGNNIDANLTATEAGTPINDIVETAEWTITPDVQPTGGSYGVQLYTSNMAGLTDGQFTVLKRPEASTNYADWSTEDGTTTIPEPSSPGRTVASGYAEKLGFTSFSKFGVGKGPRVLPIELLAFNVVVNNDVAEITWTTQTEINNDYFTIEKSTDGINYNEVIRVNGAGNSYEQREYMEVDYNLTNGKSYYRLKQTDFDGTTTTSKIVAVTYFGEKGDELYIEASLNVYPNPALTGEQINIKVEHVSPEEELLVVVRDIRGQEMYSKITIADYDGNAYVGVDPSFTLAAGTYLIIGSSDNRMFSKKLIIK